MNLIEFIDHILITEIRRIQQDYDWKHTYLSFGLISQGIEFLGSLTDEFDLQMERPGESKNRFNRAIQNFFNSPYHEYTDDANPFSLYKNLRCGMLHIVLPKNKLLLGERQFDFGKYRHLWKYKNESGNERLFLMAEDFYEDFRCACMRVIDIVTDKSIFTLFPKVSSASPSKRDVISLKRDLLNIDIY
jgi:hypothetical protein